jgi:hypothetical protein
VSPVELAHVGADAARRLLGRYQSDVGG